MQIPILNGIYTDQDSNFRVSYPHNMVPVPVAQGISKGYLRPAEGLEKSNDLPGLSRAGINWEDICYRVAGSELVRVNPDGTNIPLGDVEDDGTWATLDYSFDYLGITSNNKFYLYDKNVDSLRQVTDPDLGEVFDHIWVDGYFMLTDGEFLIVTELNDPFQVNPTKYGSSEADPDPVKALLKVRNEPYALNRYTIEVFDNIGGVGFPFQRIDGAQVQRGVVGTHACCVFLESVAFVGGGRNESISVWVASSGSSLRIATREIDKILAQYTEEVLSTILVESRVDQGHQHLYIHLPDQTLVYDGAASQLLATPVWFTLGSNNTKGGTYRARNFVWCYSQWWAGDTYQPQHGTLTQALSSHWGNKVAWEFGTLIVYNEGRGALFHRLELVSLSGRSALNIDDTIGTQYSLDGEQWSMQKFIRVGKQGGRERRLVWLQQGPMRNWRIQRFFGTSDAHLAVARLEAQLEQLAV